MKLIYKNKKIEEICNDFKVATKIMGKPVAIKLMSIINTLESFPNLYEFGKIPQYKLHPLFQNRINEYSIVIAKGTKWRLIIYPLDQDGNILDDRSNEKDMLIKSIQVYLKEVSEHYEK
jgi:proteic killer suppression protein